MASNYVFIVALQIDKPVIPYDEYQEFIISNDESFDTEYKNGFELANHPLYAKFVKDSNYKERKQGCFCYPERLWGNEWNYLEQQWHKYYQDDAFDINAMFKIDEYFLLNSGLFKDDVLSQNMNWIDALKEQGYTLFFHCA